MSSVRVEHFTKRYDSTTAVDDISFEVKPKEYVTLLGPSGCGKTTTLRFIAGFVTPDSGRLFIEDKEMEKVPINKRKLGMVFQNWALWPHMTVSQNVAFGLQVRKVSREETRRRVDDAIAMMKLSGMEERYPSQLSGGQQQRVALARALVVEPRVMLLDEPLSNLDAKLRQSTRVDLQELQRKVGITFVYVTHDQEEALAVSDRIFVMRGGKIAQMGTPEEIYEKPSTEFVADFVGTTNIYLCKVLERRREGAVLETEGGLRIEILAEEVPSEDRVRTAIRPEKVEISRGQLSAMPNHFKGMVSNKTFLGPFIRYRVRIGDETLLVDSNERIGLGEEVEVAFSADSCRTIGNVRTTK